MADLKAFRGKSKLLHFLLGNNANILPEYVLQIFFLISLSLSKHVCSLPTRNDSTTVCRLFTTSLCSFCDSDEVAETNLKAIINPLS